jgi:CHAT domain-containing protein
LRPFAFDAARALYGHLLRPLEAEFAGVNHLVLATSGFLGKLPFAALITSPGETAGAESAWLARRFAVSQVPSAGAWLAIRRQGSSARATEPLLAWGDPTFGPQVNAATDAAVAQTRRVLSQRSVADVGSTPARQATSFRYADFPALPETRDELRSIALALNADPQTDLLVGAQATRESVLGASRRGALASRKVVVFATHGLMAGDLPNLSQPALALAVTPEADRNPLQPLLLLDDVLGLKLNADWVVLSACNTAAADGKAEEALSGLARGFFYAGARSLLVTHWAVETESAKLLTTGTFAHYVANAEDGKAESLRQAMLRVMSMPQYGHPAYWAPYALVGDGGH